MHSDDFFFKLVGSNSHRPLFFFLFWSERFTPTQNNLRFAINRSTEQLDWKSQCIINSKAQTPESLLFFPEQTN